jgi:hypothetical protein
VLDPHHSDSRFLTKLRYKGFPDRAEVWWAKDWAIVVEGQARRGRDVCGLTADSQMKVAAQARKWWANREQRGVNLGPLGRATVMGGPLPPGAVAITPAYRLGAAPPRVATPTLAGPLPAWTVAQRLNRVYQAAGEGRTTERQIRETMAALGPVADGVLRDVAMRFGIADAGDRAGVLRLLERQLRDRLAEANRLKRPTPPKAPTPPLPPAPIPPATPMRIPAPLPFAPILPGVFADAPIPAEIAAALPEGLRGAQVLSDLARTRAGLAWWKAVGRTLWDGLGRRAG